MFSVCTVVWNCVFFIWLLQEKLRHFSFSHLSSSQVRWCWDVFIYIGDMWYPSSAKCMRERTFTTRHWTTNRCARSVASCVSSVDSTAMHSAYVMYLRTQMHRSVSARTWCATNNSVQTPFIRAMHPSMYSCLHSVFCGLIFSFAVMVYFSK